MTQNLTGEIQSIGAVQQITDNFSKRCVIVKTDITSPYPQFIQLETSNIKNTLLDTFKVGEMVSIDYNLNGNLNKNDSSQAFVKLSIWKINKI